MTRIVPGLRRAPRSVLSGLSSPYPDGPERPSFLQAAGVYPISNPRGRALEAVFVAFAVGSIAAAYAWSGRFWVDLVDEGYFLDLGQRVLNGQLPYRDFTTYYTPGIFYLFALVFKAFGTNLLVIRCLMAVVRGLCALLVYGLARRVAPPPLAWLPFLVVAALDHWPIEPEPHPSWPSLLASLLTLELVVRNLETGLRRWLVLAGAAAALAYLFKQNMGAFTVLGVAGYIVLRPRQRAGGILRIAQVTYALGAAASITLLMRANLDVLSAGALWLPLMVALGLLTYRAMRGPAVEDGSVVFDGAATAASFGLVTVGWLAPLVAALGPGETPVALFLGSVDQTSIATAFPPFTDGIRPLLLAAIWLPILVLGLRNRALGAVTLSLSAAALALPGAPGPRDPLTRDPLLLPPLSWLDNSFGTLHLYLPSLGVWAGVAALFMLKNEKGPYPWYVLFGGLAALSLYPRADTLHAVVASPVALIAGAGALALVYRALSSERLWRRASVLVALLALPLAAVAPQVMWRIATLVTPPSTSQRLDYAPLQLPRAAVLVPRQTAEDIRGAVTFMQAGTPPGAPLLAYPVAPLFNFLADRPNPTRFDHFLPGTLTAQNTAEVIDDLRRTQPRYVLWDHNGIQVWDPDIANRVLSDYIWTCYRQVATFRLYLVLERNADVC